MRWRQDFHVGYSPERINPGDREHSFARIVKVVSGDDPETLEKVADLYASVVSAGVHRVSSIRVAEAAKVIENTQRSEERRVGKGGRVWGAWYRSEGNGFW